MNEQVEKSLLSPSVTANFERKKVYQYVVTLKNIHVKYVDIFSVFLLGISVALFTWEQWVSAGANRIYLFCPIAIVTIVIYNIYKKRTGGGDVSYKTALFIAAIGWAIMPYLSWLFLPFVGLGILEKGARLPLEIGFADNKIVINTLIRRSYEWTDFNNIILKDNLLTLDFKNNRLLQRETVDDDEDAGEDEFNDYCQQQLNASSRI
jgi:hypothetical protein